MREVAEENKYQKKIITIPNLLSLVRLFLIPVIVWLYLGKKDYMLTGILVLISGLTDVVDGWIARTFNMISDLGKVLDPIADKSTQAVVVILLATRFPLILLPLSIGIIKEIFMTISGYFVVKKCNVVLGAEWHGKLATVLLTLTMALHLVWFNISPVPSAITIVLSGISIALSLALYAVRNISYLRGKYKAECKNAT